MTAAAKSLETSATAPKLAVAADDPLAVLKGLVGLRRVVGLYPRGHPLLVERVTEVERDIQRHLRASSSTRLQFDVIQSDVHFNGNPVRLDPNLHGHIVRDLTEIGVHSVQLKDGISAEELREAAEFLWEFDGEPGGDPVEARLARRGVTHITLGRIVPLDTRWVSQQYPDAPTGHLDPAYAESLQLAQDTFDSVSSGKSLDQVTVRDLVQLLIRRVARSNAALGQVLAVKQYENLTYVHSVNVAMLSLLIGREVGLDDSTIAALTEAALLHDIGKTRVPLEVVRKPGKLDPHERKLIEAHATYGAEILADSEGLRPLTPTIALEHHRTVQGAGYPDLGDGVIPHPMSQIVSVADVYEALTGARTYKEPHPPEKACLILARIAGEQLNSALVKAFINTITFYPVGSFVKTSRDELGVVVRTNPKDPMRPTLALVDETFDRVLAEIDLSARGTDGTYERHIVETLRPPEQALDLTKFLAAEPPEL